MRFEAGSQLRGGGFFNGAQLSTFRQTSVAWPEHTETYNSTFGMEIDDGLEEI
jgi:hypothetical protein